MSRIRSVHPGFFTDEDLVSVSMGARLLFIGLTIEADDKGIFEWKPLTIKMRVFPADAVDIPELLAELESAGAVKRFDKFGAIRNFCKFQRPKKPNDIHPAAAEMLAFTAHSSELEAAKPDAVPHQLPTSGEKSPQMEDGGGNRSSVSNETALVDPDKVMFDAGVALITSCGKSESAARSWLGKARKAHGPEAVIAAIGRAKREGAPDPIAFMEGSFRAQARASPEPRMASPC